MDMRQSVVSILMMATLGACASSSEAPNEPFLDANSIYFADFLPSEVSFAFCRVESEIMDCSNENLLKIGRLLAPQGPQAVHRTGNNPDAKREFQYRVAKYNAAPGQYALAAIREDRGTPSRSRLHDSAAQDATLVINVALGRVFLMPSFVSLPSSFNANTPEHLKDELATDFSADDVANLTFPELSYARLDCDGVNKRVTLTDCKIGPEIGYDDLWKDGVELGHLGRYLNK